MYFKNLENNQIADITSERRIIEYKSSPIWQEITEAEYEARKPKEVEYKPTYEELVEQKIRAKYSVSDELAILRQRDVDEKHRKRFDEYNTFCENCCLEAREEVNNGQGIK